MPLEENLETAQEELDDILHKLFQDINGLNKAIYGEDAGNYRQKFSWSKQKIKKLWQNVSSYW